VTIDRKPLVKYNYAQQVFGYMCSPLITYEETTIVHFFEIECFWQIKKSTNTIRANTRLYIISKIGLITLLSHGNLQ